MDCPHCKIPVLGNMGVCPKCKYNIKELGGGENHLQWLIDHGEPLSQVQFDHYPKFIEAYLKQNPQYTETFLKQNSQYAEALQKLKATIEKEEEERRKLVKLAIEQDQKAVEIAGGFWQYKVVSLVDGDSGAITPYEIETTINELGSKGWHLRCAFTNEIGFNSSSSGYSMGVGGMSSGSSTGTNATIDQNILIFERFIKLNN